MVVSGSNLVFDDYSKESEMDYLGGLSPFIINLDEKVTEAVIVARYSFSATDNILYELKKNYENMKQNNENVGEEENAGYDIEILSKIVEQNFSSLFSLHIMAVNPTDECNSAIVFGGTRSTYEPTVAKCVC